MAFDVADLLEDLFGGGPIMATAAAVPGPDDDGGGRQHDDDGVRFADWVRRPDWHGLMGWEAPGLPESDRWWARCDFDDLPEVPEGFSIGELPKVAHQDSRGCVSGGMVDTQDLGNNRLLQRPLEGFVRV